MGSSLRKLSMDGKIRTKEKCPKCGGKFSLAVVTDLGLQAQLCCPSCKTRPRRYFIDLNADDYGRVKIYSDNLGNPFESWPHVERTLTRIRAEIDDFTFDPTRYAKSDLKKFLFESRIEAWFKSKEKEAEKENLAKSYTHCLKRYKDMYYLPFFRDTLKGIDVRKIRTFYIQQFYEEHLPSSLSLKYTKNIMDALRNFFTSLHRLDFIKEVPTFPIITLDRTTPKWINRDTQIGIIKEIPDEDRPIFTFLAFQGVRPGEAIVLKVKDIDLQNESITISRTLSYKKIRERVKSKVIKPRAINPLILDMLKGLCRNKHPEAFIFINPRTGRPYIYNKVLHLWLAACKKKKIEISLYQATRHSLASNLLKDGAALKAIGDILGHTDLRTTLKYAHGDLDNQRIAFNKQGGIKGELIGLCPPSVPEKSESVKNE